MQGRTKSSGFKMKGSPMYRNFGIGAAANTSGVSGLTKGSPAQWAFLVGLLAKAGTAAKAAIGAAKLGVAKAGTWLAGGTKTALGKAMGKGVAKMGAKHAGTKAAAGVIKKTGAKSLGKTILHGVKGSGGETITKGLLGDFSTKAGRKKLIKKGKEFGMQQAGMAAFGSLTTRGEDYQPGPTPDLPQIGGTQDKEQDPIQAASGLKYKKKKKKSKKHRAYEMMKKHSGKPGFQEYVDRVFGGKTTLKGSTTYTSKNI